MPRRSTKFEVSVRSSVDEETPVRLRGEAHPYLARFAEVVELRKSYAKLAGYDVTALTPETRQELGDAFFAVGALVDAFLMYEQSAAPPETFLEIGRALEDHARQYGIAFRAYHMACDAAEIVRLTRRAMSERATVELHNILSDAATYERTEAAPFLDLTRAEYEEAARLAVANTDPILLREVEDRLGLDATRHFWIELGDACTDEALFAPYPDDCVRNAEEAYARAGVAEKLVDAVERLASLVVESWDEESRSSREPRLSLKAWASLINHLVDTHRATATPIPRKRLLRVVERLLRYAEAGGKTRIAATILCNQSGQI